MTRPVIPYSTDTLPDWLQGDARKEKPFRAIGDTQRRVIVEAKGVAALWLLTIGLIGFFALMLEVILK